MRRVFLCTLVAVMLMSAVSVTAQDNLLDNPGFNEPYPGRGRTDLNIPVGWEVWVLDSPQTEAWMNNTPGAFPHRTTPEVRVAPVSLNLAKGFATFTVAVYQQVNVPAGANVRGSVYAWLHTCGDPGEEPEETCQSEPSSGAFVRAGIDPTGGTDPLSGSVVWSGNITPHGTWGQAVVDATAQGETVTFFAYTSQREPRSFNRVFFDEASLVVGGEGGGAPSGDGDGGGVPSNTAPPVAPQGERDDGSIMHIVQPGDTVNSIAFAYDVTAQDIIDLNGLDDGRIIQIGQELLVKEGEAPEETPEPEPVEVAEAVEPVEEDPVEVTNREENEPADDDDDDEPEATEEPPQPTPEPFTLPDDLPPAPVVSAAFGASDPTVSNSAVCALVFNDLNFNRIQEAGENLLPSARIALGEDTYTTDGVSEPHCFTGVSAGEYTIRTTPPDGFGMTSPDQLVVQVYAGETVTVAVGAAEGVQPPQPPPASSGDLTEATVTEDDPTLTQRLFERSGWVFLGAAALVLFGGMGITLASRR